MKWAMAKNLASMLRKAPEQTGQKITKVDGDVPLARGHSLTVTRGNGVKWDPYTTILTSRPGT